MQFTGDWRDYQARVLGEMENHFDDKRLHVVAAPGAGKTVLGLEIIRRIGRPALIFSPTVAIREQWLQRLCPLFLADSTDNGAFACPGLGSGPSMFGRASLRRAVIEISG